MIIQHPPFLELCTVCAIERTVTSGFELFVNRNIDSIENNFESIKSAALYFEEALRVL